MPARWQQIETLYPVELERMSEARAAYLAAACVEDAGLRVRCKRLLGAGFLLKHYKTVSCETSTFE